MPSSRPRPGRYRTRSEYVWARRLWLRRHGGALWPSLAIAVFFGLASGSQWALFALLAFAVGAHAVARSRP